MRPFKALLLLLFSCMMFGCNSINNGTYHENPSQSFELSQDNAAAIRQKNEEIRRLREENERLRREAEYVSHAKSEEEKSEPETAKSGNNARQVITYNDVLGRYSIVGNGKYGYVSLDATYLKVLDKLSISGTVGDSYISLDCNHLEVLDKTSISGDCGDFGYASLDINRLDVLGKATLTGSVGDSYINISATGVRKTTNWTFVSVYLVALMFDAK